MSRMNELEGGRTWKGMGCEGLSLPCPGDNIACKFSLALPSVYVLLAGSPSLTFCYVNVMSKLQLMT